MDPVFIGHLQITVDQCQLCGASFPSIVSNNSFTLCGEFNGVMY